MHKTEKLVLNQTKSAQSAKVKTTNLHQQLETGKQMKKLQKFVEILAEEEFEYQDVRKLSHGGIPECVRGKIWKYLLKYRLKSTDIMSRKREQYKTFINKYLKVYNFELIQSEVDRKIAKVIEADIKRTLPEAKLTKNMRVQTMLTRCLYIWHIKHPASGYVQGINDLVVPFFLAFLSEYKPISFNNLQSEVSIEDICDQTLHFIQADIYWCISKMLQYVTTNYIGGFKGIQQASNNIQILLQKIDQVLYQHLLQKKIDIFWMSFREISTFLLRIVSPKMGLRLFDTYISYEGRYPIFMQYLLVTIFERFSGEMVQMKFDDLMKFLQNMPSKDWSEQELQRVISQASVFMDLYRLE